LSSVRIVFPKPKLAKLLIDPGGKPVVEALEEAKANLSVLQPECRAELEVVARQIEECFDRTPPAGDGPSTVEFYNLAAGGVGLGAVAGLASVDDTLVSLCNLMDYFQVHGRWDHEALRVHVQTLKLLVSGADLPPAAVEAVLAGLQRVNLHYKPAVDAKA
jgi:hypothetical protein